MVLILLLGMYFILSLTIMFVFRQWHEPPDGLRLAVHVLDTLWPVVLSTLAVSRSNALFLFFFFGLLAAAYRWGLWETLATGASMIVAPAIVAATLQHGRWFQQLPPELETNRLFERAVSLLVISLLLGYMAEEEKELRGEKAVIARILGKARVELGMSGTLSEMLQELQRLYGAKKVVLASQEATSIRIFLGEAASGTFHWTEASPSDQERYLFESPADVWYARRKASRWSTIALSSSGIRLRDFSPAFLQPLWEAWKVERLAGVAFTFGEDWSGRIFLLDPALRPNRVEELRFLQEMVRQVGPAAYNVFLLRRLRQRAGAVERARVARELHDGAVQSLIAVEMQVDVVRRQAEPLSSDVTQELGRIQNLLREEVLKLRELMQQMKSLDVDGRHLPGFLADVVERFQRETGIQARFFSDVQEVPLASKVCRELARIIQEALVNVRKHSKGQHALVRLGVRDGSCQLQVEDDGQGFDFTGCLSLKELDDQHKGPVVIRERVHFIGGELTIESKPGHGTRLEVRVPAQE